VPGLRTEYPFTLPKGFVDVDGTLHRHGVMRLATARDEIESLRDQRIAGPDDPYLTVLVLARVITELGAVPQVTPSHVEGLFAADLAFLQDLYGIINFGDPADVAALQATVPENGTVAADEPDWPDDEFGTADGPEDEPSGQPTRARSRVEEVPSKAQP
jgi:hypothetical protein